MKKTLASCFLILSLLLSLFTINVMANENITIYVNEQILQCDVAPFIDNGRTMVPMRKIFEALNTKVAWEGSTQIITATKANTNIVLQINNPTMYNNGVAETLDVVPVIINSSTFVPIRAVSQSLHASVEWNERTKSVYINSPDTYKKEYDAYFSNETTITMYAPDGRTITVLPLETETYQSVGWYYEPVTTMYATDGRNMYVPISEVEAHKNAGWYPVPVTIMYAPDGRTMVIDQNDVTSYKAVGWYETLAASQAASAPSYSDAPMHSFANTSTPSYDNQPNSDGSAVYRTPSGKRYHFDPNCGGKNSYQTTLQKAKSAGLTPCQKCAC